MNKKVLRYFLLLVFIEGFLAEAFLFWIPSEQENALWGSFSSSRLAMGATILLFLITLVFLIIKGWTNKNWIEKFCQDLDRNILTGNRIYYMMVSLIYALLCGLAICILFYSPAAENMHRMTPIFFRLQSVFYWGLLIILQSIIVLFLSYRQVFKARGAIPKSIIARTILILGIISFTAFYWAILVFQDALFVAIEGWFWQFHVKKININDLIFLGVVGLAFACIIYIARHMRFPHRNLIILIFLGYILQVSFGLIEGRGFESIRLEFSKSFHKSFAEHASDNPDPFNAMLNYEQIYGPDINLGTKPPGALLFYIGAQKISNIVNPETTFDGRLARLTNFMAYVFPFLATLAILPLYYLSRYFLGSEDAIIPCVLYVLSTNFILMPLSIDQFLYPTLFILGFLFCLKSIRQQSFSWAVLSGGFIYLVIFFSFSLLPLAPAVFVWVCIDYILNRKQRRLIDTIKIMAGLTLGILSALLLLRILLNYDILLRYQNALLQHRTHKEFKSDIPHFLTALVINNFEFLFWTGVPILILALSRGIKAIRNLLQKNANALDGFSFTLIILYVALNFFGQTRSETGRLWLFMVPGLSILSANEMKTLFKKNELNLFFIAGLLLISAFLTFQFQDFYF